MSKLFPIVCAALALTAVSGSAHAEMGIARAAMGQCVDRVLSTLVRSRAPAAEAGRAVLSQCDRQLRDTLAEAIRTGEAPFCTVSVCMGLARSRASGEAADAYRKLLRGA